MRVVLDTNVLARAARGGSGPAAELLRIVMVPPHVLIVSPFILSELARSLRYPRLRKLHGLDDQQINSYVQSIQAAAVLVVAPGLAAAVSTDPDDDAVVAAAVAGSAETLCTRDRHLHQANVKSHGAAHGIQIVTDVELLHQLRPPAP
jgi:putative PIN family toxin of toxin-antitoxin system